MKRCPTCNRIEKDDALVFCRADGTRLVSGAPDTESAATLALPAVGPSADQPTSQSDSKPSIAVLPFLNMSADPENEYFCDGLAEDLLNALGKINDLKVAARTSSFSFKGKSVNVDEIGRTLHVNTILEGSARRVGNRMRISVQLINASDGYHLWSERYDREITDIFDVQDEITLAVTEALKVKLLGEEKSAVLKRYTDNAEAYQLYLRGRFFHSKRTPEGFTKAIGYFEQAIQIDSEYALAYSGLADCHVFLGFYEVVWPTEVKKHLKPLAYKALQLDDTLAESWVSVGYCNLMYEWKFREAHRDYKKAVALNPKYAFAHHLGAGALIFLGLNDEAIAAIKRAIELEPFTTVFNGVFGWWLYISRRNDEAITQSRKTIEIAPNHFFAYWVIGMAYAKSGEYENSIAALESGIALTDGSQHIRAELGRVLAASGEREAAHTLLAELNEQAKTGYVSAVNLAKIYLGLGDHERVFDLLEKAFDERAVKLPWFLIDPALDELRSDPRFTELLRRVGLPNE